MYRFVWRPQWLAGHVLVLAAAAVMVWLGHWQLGVSESKGFSLQNFGYALQWWAFSIAALVFWVRLLRDKAHGVPMRREPEPAPAAGPGNPAPVAYRRYVRPDDVPTEDDPELDRYNAYLASLNDDE